ncbi:hypothetical protein COU54_04640 [Candidatus Pacearchaeota archaeon CG10_big_fil_rev_8_21_14_0_10_31_24]|nr:MAG: hypothetical protein COU54_04640 [Candidatus Pacearchaeota archaeon CG10_big_fil_rev_8_21_14_0_10_31_24]
MSDKYYSEGVLESTRSILEDFVRIYDERISKDDLDRARAEFMCLLGNANYSFFRNGMLKLGNSVFVGKVEALVHSFDEGSSRGIKLMSRSLMAYIKHEEMKKNIRE